MKYKDNGKDATQNLGVFVAGHVVCCISSAFLTWCPFHDKHESDQNHYLGV